MMPNKRAAHLGARRQLLVHLQLRGEGPSAQLPALVLVVAGRAVPAPARPVHNRHGLHHLLPQLVAQPWQLLGCGYCGHGGGDDGPLSRVYSHEPRLWLELRGWTARHVLVAPRRHVSICCRSLCSGDVRPPRVAVRGPLRVREGCAGT